MWLETWIPIEFCFCLSHIGRIEENKAPQTLVTLQITLVKLDAHADVRHANHPAARYQSIVLPGSLRA